MPGFRLLYGTALAVILIGVGVVSASSDNKADGDPAPLVYRASLVNNDGNETGEVTLTQAEDGVLVHVSAKGLPAGSRGFHIHETGNCTPMASFTDAGSHLNTDDNAHGFLHKDGHHAGDMPNLIVKKDGTVEAEIYNSAVSLIEGEEGYLLDADGSAVVIHADADDYNSQTTGNAGDRIACAEIK